MNLGLQGKVAIVTGGSKGIGKATALALAHEGSNVAICARGIEALEETAEELRTKTGQTILAVRADVNNTEDIKAMISTTVSQLGGVDILMNNAVNSIAARFMDLPDEAWANHINVKIMGYIRCSREVIPYMQRRGGGRIINIGGLAARRVYDRAFTNGITNSAISNLTKNLSDQFAADNIIVNCIHPGSVRTPRATDQLEKWAKEQSISTEEALGRMVKDIPLGRIVEAEDIANAVLFLVSDKASMITGQSIAVDGGETRGINY